MRKAYLKRFLENGLCMIRFASKKNAQNKPKQAEQAEQAENQIDILLFPIPGCLRRRLKIILMIRNVQCF